MGYIPCRCYIILQYYGKVCNIQGSPHTGREWLAPTTTQACFTTTHRWVKSAEMLCLMQFASTLAKV